MRKSALAAALLAAFAAVSLAAQEVPGTPASTGVNLLNVSDLERYIKPFLNGNGLISRTYSRAASDEDKTRLRGLGGDPEVIDTPLEIAILSTCAGVVDVRPVMPPEVEAILPKNNPKQADLKLGAAVYQEMQILRFLGNTAAVGRHEGIIKFISDRGNVSRAEIDAYYRQGIGALIAETVDAEFNRIGFTMGSPTGGYNAVLTRSSNPGYTLRYEDARNVTGEISAPTLETLLSAMSRNTAEFNQNGITRVREQAALIPAVALSAGAVRDITTILTNFYISPDTSRYSAVREVYSLFHSKVMHPVFNKSSSSYLNTLEALNAVLARKVARDDAPGVYAALTREQRQRLVSLRE